MLTANEIIKHLHLEKHCEGGYFYQTYRSSKQIHTDINQNRQQITSIYYLLTKASHLSYFVKNTSDLILYYHLGSPLKVIFINTDGSLTEKILGPDIQAGQQLQIACPANVYKAYSLMQGEYALVGEAVAPGFEYEDMEIPGYNALKTKYPKQIEQLKKYIRPEQSS